MANDCLVTKLKGVVNNNNLPYFGYYTVTYLETGKDIRFTPSKDSTSGSIKVVDGDVYADNEFTVPVTDIPTTMWIPAQYYKKDGEIVKIVFRHTDMGVFGDQNSIFRGSFVSNSAVPKVYKSELIQSNLFAFNLYMTVFADEDKSIEPLLIGIFHALIRRGTMNYERSNIATKQFWPTISNRRTSALSWAPMTFNGNPFCNMFLCMATDIANNTFYLYNNGSVKSNTNIVLDENSLVASYNDTTGEWTYYDE